MEKTRLIRVNEEIYTKLMDLKIKLESERRRPVYFKDVIAYLLKRKVGK